MKVVYKFTCCEATYAEGWYKKDGDQTRTRIDRADPGCEDIPHRFRCVQCRKDFALDKAEGCRYHPGLSLLIFAPTRSIINL